uniref:SFRICE_016809 n=1 Tax=Spodoptera frugiperda TaxID=7108 RepID=A0A2H1VLA9_SPOFR
MLRRDISHTVKNKSYLQALFVQECRNYGKAYTMVHEEPPGPVIKTNIPGPHSKKLLKDMMEIQMKSRPPVSGSSTVPDYRGVAIRVTVGHGVQSIAEVGETAATPDDDWPW